MIKSLVCEDGCPDKLCVRRVAGMIGFLAFAVRVAVGGLHPQLALLGILSASLLGLTTLDKFTGIKPSGSAP